MGNQLIACSPYIMYNTVYSPAYIDKLLQCSVTHLLKLISVGFMSVSLFVSKFYIGNKQQ